MSFMERPRRTDEQLISSARRVMHQTQSLREFRQALAVLLPAELYASLGLTARVSFVERATIPRLRAGFRRRSDAKDSGRKGWGGRRRTLTS